MRKKGLIAGFCNRKPDYLELIISDLGLDADVNQLRYLQKVYSKAPNGPTVADLYFDTYYMRHSLMRPDSAAVCAINCDDENILELWTDFIKRYTSRNGTATPSLTKLAGFALDTGEKTLNASVSFDEYPEIPAPGSTVTSFFPAGGKKLSLAEFGCDNGITNGMYGHLLRPGAGMSFEEFTLRAHRMFYNIRLSDPGAKFLSLTYRGLLGDIMSVCDSGEIICNAIEAEALPEACVNAYLPGAIIFAKPRCSGDAEKYSAAEGIAHSVVYKWISDSDGFVIKGDSETVVKTKHMLEQYEIMQHVTMAAASPEKYCNSINISIPGETLSDIKAYSLGTDVYTTLARHCNGNWAIAGTLNPDDPSVIPFILQCDAFVRNTSHRPFAAGFIISDKTDITLFCSEQT